jgi:hypothetical protein
MYHYSVVDGYTTYSLIARLNRDLFVQEYIVWVIQTC